MLKCQTVVDGAIHEAGVVEVERTISSLGVPRVMDRLAFSRGAAGTTASSAAATRTSNRSAAACATDASTSTGFPASCMPALKLKAGDGNTTRNDRRRFGRADSRPCQAA